MAISQAQQLDTSDRRWIPLIFCLILAYISLITLFIIVKKYEFAPFQEARDNFVQFNPFGGQVSKASHTGLPGQGIVVRLNTLCNSIIDKTPEFNTLYFSQNMLGERCAKDPSQVNFVVYIKYDKQQIAQHQPSKKIIYQLQKQAAIVDWKTKELVAQKTFVKNYTFFLTDEARTLEVDKKLCLISEEPSDLELKQWIASLASVEPY